MFSRNFRLRKSFLRNTRALQRRFIVFGVLNLLLLPFTLIFMVMYFFLKNAEVQCVAPLPSSTCQFWAQSG